MDMELRHLRYFVAVAECKGFVRASVSLHVAQPALSRQIRELEQEMHVTLFERSRSGASLTLSGECFLHDAQRILASVEEAKNRALQAQSGYSGTLAIGMVESFTWHEAITDALREFQRRSPDIVLNISLLSSPQQLAAIRDEQISAGFLFNRPREDDTLDGTEVMKTRALLAVHKDSPFAKRPPQKLAELKEQNFVFIQRSVNPPYYDHVISACNRAGLTPRIVQSGNNDSSNLSLVAAGLGVTIVPDVATSRKPKDVVLVPVSDLNVVTKMELVWRKDNRLPALKNFVQCLQGKKVV